MPKEKTKRRLQPVRSAHIDDITKRFGAIQTDKPYNRTPIRKKDRKSQETYEVMPFSLAAASFPPPPTQQMSAAAMSAEAAEDAAREREFQELLDMGPDDYGDARTARAARAAYDVNDLANDMSGISMNEIGGGYRKHKSRRHKTRRHKFRRHKFRRHKTRRHKFRRY